MSVLATATGPVHIDIKDADGNILMTHEELQAAAFRWIEEHNRRILQREFEDQAIQILFEGGPEAFINFLFG